MVCLAVGRLDRVPEQPWYRRENSYTNNISHIEGFNLLAGEIYFRSEKERWLRVYTNNSTSHSLWDDEACERNRSLDRFLQGFNILRTLDGEMKRIRSTGAGTKKKQVEIITPDEEEKLWSSGTLGDHSPTSLLNTIFYMCGVYFAVRSGQENCQLRHSPCQIEVVEKPGERSYLLYTEDISKHNQGGIKDVKLLQLC